MVREERPLCWGLRHTNQTSVSRFQCHASVGRDTTPKGGCG
jgi:hypothetical protein